MSHSANVNSRKPSRVTVETSNTGQPRLVDLRADEVGEFAGLGDVDLVEHHRARTVGEVAEGRVTLQGRPVGRQLGLERVDVGDRVAAGFQGGAVDHVHQHRAAFDVTQEVQAQAAALGGAGDQARARRRR